MAMSEALSSEVVQAAWGKLTEEIRTGVLLTLVGYALSSGSAADAHPRGLDTGWG